MRWPARLRSLLSQFTLRVIVPLTVVMLVMIATGLYAYQQTITSLLVDRDRQLAALSAAQLSEAMAGYARQLETLASSPDIRSDSAAQREAVLESTGSALRIFTGGIVLVDPDGAVLNVALSDISPVGPTVTGRDYFTTARERLAPAFSDIVVDARTGQNMIVIAVPVLDESQRFEGALLGAVDLDNTSLSEPFERLQIGSGGIAYLVDRNGRVIFHPDPQNIGADYADRPYVEDVSAGQSGGTLWRARTGEQVVLGYAPVTSTGWGLIVREPWESVIGPVRTYGALMALVALVAVGVTAYLLLQGVTRIAVPVGHLVRQTVRLASGETVEPLTPHGIHEIDALEHAFNQMAAQIASYRAGLRRYVEAVTQSQEEERRRIARELHDDTVQSLLTVARRLELYQASEKDPERLAQLAELQKMVTTTMQGVRQLSRDLRPLILEDLGLIPAVRALVHAAREGEGAVPQALLDVTGEPANLSTEQELALYRISQEALTNVRKHARATRVCVELSFDPAAVRLEIGDDGLGFEVPFSLTELAQCGRFGLVGIDERVRAGGGSLRLKSAPGQGTRLSIQFTLEKHPT